MFVAVQGDGSLLRDEDECGRARRSRIAIREHIRQLRGAAGLPSLIEDEAALDLFTALVAESLKRSGQPKVRKRELATAANGRA